MLRILTAFGVLVASGSAMAQHCSSSKNVAHNEWHTPHVVAKAVAHSESAPDIVDTAVSAGNFNTLVAAVKAAGLVDALKGDGPLTVFAPTDDAFAKIPAETLQALLTPEGKDQLTKILTYHVVPGQVTADQVVNLRSAKTLQGEEVAVGVAGGKVFVDNARVVQTDILTGNGVIHVIDTVLMPSE